MIDDFRSRMSELRQEMDLLTSQAEDLERVAQEQQGRLEEMDLLVRQRDDQLAEQQTRIDELETTLQEREQELGELREHLAGLEATLSQQNEDLEDLRAQLVHREETIQTLREELAHAETQLAEQEAPPEEEALQSILERFSTLEKRMESQGETLSQLHAEFKQEMSELHQRLSNIELALTEAILRPAPAAVAVHAPPEEIAPVEQEAPVLAEQAAVVLAEEAPAVLEAAEEILKAPPVIEPAPLVLEEPEIIEKAPAAEAAAALEELPLVSAAEIAAAPPEVSVAVEDPLQALLYDALENLPGARMAGLAGHDGLGVEVATLDGEQNKLLEIELAELMAKAHRAANALGTGPLLTLAFLIGEEHCLVSPVSTDYFTYLLTPAESTDQFRRAQAVLLQAASRLKELL